MAYHLLPNFGEAKAALWWQRLHDSVAPAWVVTISIGGLHGTDRSSALPQCMAVIDDFGNLVMVGGWQ